MRRPVLTRATLALGLLAGLLMNGCVHYTAEPLSPVQTAAQLESRSLDNPQLQRFLKENAGRDFPEWPPKEWDFESLSWTAFYYHPSLELARAQWLVARGGISTAAARPNPTVSVSPGYNFSAASGVSPWFPGLTYDLPIETAGKRKKRLARSHWQAEAARQNLFTAAWQVRTEVRRALIDYRALAHRAEAMRSQITAQRRVQELLEQRLRAGAASATEVSLARLAVLRAETDVAEADRQATVARSRLALAIGVPARALKGQHFSDAGTIRELTPEQLAEARRQSLQTRADVLGALANYQASQATLQLEIAKQYPDIHLGSGYQWDQGDNKWNLALTLELPVLNRNQGPIAEAKARRREAAAQLLAVQARILGDVDTAEAAHTAALGQIASLRQMHEALQKQVELVKVQLGAGAVDQLEYQTARLELGVSELAISDAEARAAAAAGQLEDALQVPFASLPAVENDPRPLPQPHTP